MEPWKTFWTIWLLFSGVAFAAITVVVSIKGIGDVRRMLSGIKSHDDEK
jgi:hypothetical protein